MQSEMHTTNMRVMITYASPVDLPVFLPVRMPTMPSVYRPPIILIHRSGSLKKALPMMVGALALHTAWKIFHWNGVGGSGKEEKASTNCA